MERKNTNLRIAMFGHKRIPSREGGIEVVVGELSTRLVALGYSVTCYNRRGHFSSSAGFGEIDPPAFEGIRIKDVPTIRKIGLSALTSSFFSALYTAFGKYDVVHIHAEGPAFFSWLPKLFGKHIVVTIHGIDWKREKWQGSFGSQFIHIGEKCAARYADELIVLSKDTQKYFKETYGRETRLIPNGVNRPVLQNADLITKQFNLHKDEYLLFLGRLVPEKGIRYLIEAFKNADGHPGVQTDKKLVIAGSSDSDTFAEELTSMAQSDKRIIFTGFVQGKLLEELYSNAYVYILPSDLEGMPLSLLEAMSYGNCCVVSDITECTDVVEDKAVAFKKGDTADLREKLQALCSDSLLVERYKTEARDFICQKYNWDEVVKETVECYRVRGK